MLKSKVHDKIHDQVQKYYGEILSGSDDLKTDAVCCSSEAPPRYVREVIPLIAPEILDRYYGCGSPIPPALEGRTVLDLGCGTGRDTYILSKLVGESGHVIGVDMTDAQLELARNMEDEQMRRFGYDKSNVTFKQGYIEDLASMGIDDESIDLVVSNCVINLSPFKDLVFSEIYRVLKPGGELFFSDVFADKRIPEDLQNDPVVRGECLGGALFYEDFIKIMNRHGWGSFAVLSSDPLDVQDFALQTRLGFIGFTSKTIRAIKTDGLEREAQDYGQQAIYDGGIKESSRYFDFNEDLRLVKDKPRAIDANTAKMLQASRYGEHICISKPGEHRGEFEANRAQRALEVRLGHKRVDLGFLTQVSQEEGIVPFEDRVAEPVLLDAHAKPTTMQVNITYKCNLACKHCYLECEPGNTEHMSREVMEQVLQAFETGSYKILDITGGAPEFHPDFEWFLREGAKLADEVIVRTNLTLLTSSKYEHLIDLFAKFKVKVVGSLPFYDHTSTDAQRGAGVFERAIAAIRKLNQVGYGIEEDLILDLVYNVSGPYLPPPQELIEEAYKEQLSKNEDVYFNNLLAFNNFALGRFAHDLLDSNMFEDYLWLLANNFNTLAVTRMMCRDQINVDVDGKIYDCECNHVLELPIIHEERPAVIGDLVNEPIKERHIRTHPVCYSCSAGAGSSCGGSLV